MICAYCGEDSKATKEHIISNSVLDLFPECDITYDEARNTMYKSEPVVKDVCKVCNGDKLSYIDSYAKKFIEKYFLQVYQADCCVNVKYDYILLLKTLLKYSFNDIRAKNKDASYFDENIKSFLLDNNDREIPKPISIFAGINVNTSVCPAFVFGNKKLLWTDNLKFLDNSIIRYYDELTGHIFLREPLDFWEPEGLLFSYLFKFNSGQFIITYWNSKEDKEKGDIVIPLSYPYKLIKETSTNIELQRCTHAYNCHIPSLIDVSWGIGIADMTNSSVRTDINPVDIQNELNKEWAEQEKNIRKEFFVKQIQKKNKKKNKKKK